MNNNDLMNALSGLDPKYIDEAAFELHGQISGKGSKPSKKSSIRRVVFVTLPAVAALLLTFSVALSVVLRLNKSESASMPASDSAVYESAEEAAAEEAAAYESEAADAEAPYEAAEPAAAAEAYDAVNEAAEAEEYESAEKSEASDEAVSAGMSDTFDAEEDYASEPDFTLEKASFDKGILTVEITGELPDNAEDMEYSVKGKDSDGNEKTYGEGRLGDIMTEKEPLTLDIKDLDLPDGSYTLSVGEESAEFEV